MQIQSHMVFRLAEALESNGLGGPDPIRAARALFAALARQPGSDNPDHHAAHNAMVLGVVRSGHGRGLLASAAPDAAMLILARLVYAGATDADLAEVAAEREVGR
jgi:hypothetical protein